MCSSPSKVKSVVLSTVSPFDFDRGGLREKNVLLPSAFVSDVYRLILSLDHAVLDDDTRFLCSSLESQIKAKLLALDRHDSFTKYKTAPPDSDERELLRRDYLDKAGIHKDWISDNEVSFLF